MKLVKATRALRPLSETLSNNSGHFHTVILKLVPQSEYTLLFLQIVMSMT